MGKSKEDPIREERIQNEIIVDAYGPEEQAARLVLLLGERDHVSLQRALHRIQLRH